MWIKLFLLAVLQGVTEFLPVSSSGHLAVLADLFGFDGETGAAIGIMLHAGSLAAITVFYFKLLIGFFRREQFKLFCMVILGTIPAAIAGILLKKSGIDAMLVGFMPVVGLGFLITAAVLRISGKEKLALHRGEPVDLKDISWKQALAVGVAQMVAIIPGISRSGSTISVGLISGIRREAAAAFSFLLAIPAIAGATLLELLDLCGENDVSGKINWGEMAFAVVVSAAVSFISLAFLVKIVRKGKLSVFSYYLLILGVAVLLRYFIGMASAR